MLCEYGSLGDLIEQSTTRFAEKTAFINMGKAATYRDIGRYSNAFAAYLQGELRLSVGARRRANDAQHTPISNSPLRGA